MSRFARWKTKLQRATGYISLATFLLVMYQSAIQLSTSPTVLFLLFAAALLFIIVVAELDWHYVFQQEQAQTNVKNPLMYPMVYWSAWMLTHSNPYHTDVEAKLRETFRNVGAEELFDNLLKELAT